MFTSASTFMETFSNSKFAGIALILNALVYSSFISISASSWNVAEILNSFIFGFLFSIAGALLLANGSSFIPASDLYPLLLLTCLIIGINLYMFASKGLFWKFTLSAATTFWCAIGVYESMVLLNATSSI